MKFNNYILSTLLVVVTLVSFSCKDDDIPDYDPCWSIKSANADFIVFDSFYMYYVEDFSVEVDTVFNGNTIHFRANKPNATYEWLIGDDPAIRTEPYFELNFPSGITGDIAVRLVTTQEAHSCLSETELRDTVIKSFHLVENSPSNWFMTGEYRGVKSTHPNDSIVIKLVPGGLTPPVEGILGLFNNCQQWRDVFFTVYNRMYFESHPYEVTCEGPIGLGWLHEDRNTVEIHYTINIGMEERSDTIQFIGRRIN